jgi:hypothetical protein
VSHGRPVAYQERNGKREPVNATYIVHGNRVTFDTPRYDPTRPLVIDPVIIYSTYLGGSSEDYAFDSAVDSTGNSYTVGSTISADFLAPPTYVGGGGVLRVSLPGFGSAAVLPATPISGFIIPASRNVMFGRSTGLAIVSPNYSSNLTLTLRNRNGEPVPGGQLTLYVPPNGHIARFIDELFPNADTSNFDGTVSCVSQIGNVSAAALQFDFGQSLFTTLPVIPLR